MINNCNVLQKCAPGKKYLDGSCFTMDQLIKIANAYNNNFKNHKVEIFSNKRKFVKELINKISKNYDCDNEICWLDINFIKNIDSDIRNFTFRPKGPINSKKWLSTTNINKSLKQYEILYKDFLYLGTLPYDFFDLD